MLNKNSYPLHAYKEYGYIITLNPYLNMHPVILGDYQYHGGSSIYLTPKAMAKYKDKLIKYQAEGFFNSIQLIHLKEFQDLYKKVAIP